MSQKNARPQNNTKPPKNANDYVSPKAKKQTTKKTRLNSLNISSPKIAAP